MELKKYLLLLALGVFSLTMQSCDDDDDDDGIDVPIELRNALAEIFPNVQRVEWDAKGAYYVAEFYDNNYETSAWFTRAGEWQMTEIDIPFNALPAAVRNTFGNSKYANWKVDDVDILKRKGLETVYIIEIEQGRQEVELYYTEDGVLANERVDFEGNQNPDGYLPSELSSVVRAFISENYPNARLIEIDTERNGMIEVDIVHNNIGKEVLFSSAGAWVSTSWDVYVNSLPQAVTNAINSQYPDYRIDDADYVETPEGNYYVIEAEPLRGGQDINVWVTAEGTILQ